jgi:hypothetical protein
MRLPSLAVICLAIVCLQSATADETTKPEVAVNSLGMKFVKLPAGEFTMGSPASEEGHTEIETQRKVRITKPFYLGQHEVTVGQFRKFVTETGYKTALEREGKPGFGFEPSLDAIEILPKFNWQNTGFGTDEHPVVNINWKRRNGLLQMAERKGKSPVHTANRSSMGICLPRRHHDAFLLRRDGRLAERFCEHLRCVVPQQIQKRELEHRVGRRPRVLGAGRQPKAKRLGPVRHARQRVGMVRRLVRSRLLQNVTDRRSTRPEDGRSPHRPRRCLHQPQPLRPVRRPQRAEARVSVQLHGLPGAAGDSVGW